MTNAVAEERLPISKTGKQSWMLWVLCLVLGLGTLLVYLPALNCDFVNFDDPEYVTENPFVQKGIRWDSVLWAFTTTWAANWHPVTWLSHIVDWQLFGGRAGWHHLTNVLLHVANTVLLFLLLRRMSGALWRSAFVAALFAWHPLHVESVAWVAERKDVLSTFWGLLCLWCYARYVEEINRSGGSRWRWHVVGIIFFVMGLMSKPMLVTVPLLLLLLDVWPLRRVVFVERIQLSNTSWRGLFLEKTPFLVLALIFAIVTVIVQYHGGAIPSAEAVPVERRVMNAVMSYVWYIAKTIWPANLIAFYPLERSFVVWQVLVAAVALATMTGLAVRQVRRRPYVAAGWLWFVGMLVPVIGLIQVGGQGMADRYTYLPLVGLFVVITWFGAELVCGSAMWRRILNGVAVVILGLCVAGTIHQLQFWKNSVALFDHAIEVMPENPLAHNNLGFEFLAQADYPRAEKHLRMAIKYRPRYAMAYNNLGVALMKSGRHEEAADHFSRALELKPNFLNAHNNFGVLLTNLGRNEEAMSHFVAALKLNPRNADSYFNLGNLFYREGKISEAIANYRRALQLAPLNPSIHNNLALMLTLERNFAEATQHFQMAIRLKPESADAYNNLGNSLIEQERFDEAIPPLKQALKLNPAHSEAHFNMGNVYSALKSSAAALAEYQSAIRCDTNHAMAYYKAGNLLLAAGNNETAADHYRAALRANPKLGEAHYQLATILVVHANMNEGIKHFREAVRLKPTWVEALNNLSWILATHPQARYRDGQEATRLAAKAVELTHTNNADALDTLGVACAENGEFEKAVAAAQQALDLAKSSERKELLPQIQARMKLYQSGKPYHE